MSETAYAAAETAAHIAALGLLLLGGVLWVLIVAGAV